MLTGCNRATVREATEAVRNFTLLSTNYQSSEATRQKDTYWVAVRRSFQAQPDSMFVSGYTSDRHVSGKSSSTIRGKGPFTSTQTG